jgi:hypothetical protein
MRHKVLFFFASYLIIYDLFVHRYVLVVLPDIETVRDLLSLQSTLKFPLHGPSFKKWIDTANA